MRARIAVAAGVAPLLAFTLIGAGPREMADDKPVGSLTGTVVDSADKPAPDVLVRLYASDTVESVQRGNGGNRKRGNAVNVPTPILLAGGPPTAQSKTDAHGAFTIDGLKPQIYTYRIGDPGTVGYVAGKVTIEPGKAATLNAKLKPPVQ